MATTENKNTNEEVDVENIGTIETLESKLNTLVLGLDSQIKGFKATLTKVKAFKKEIRSLELKVKKLESKRRKNSNTKKNGGYFLMPVQISDDLIAFIKKYTLVSLESHKYPKPVGTETQKKKIREKNEKDRIIIPSLIERVQKLESEEGKNLLSRVDVTRIISKFVRHYGLQNQEEKKLIKLNDTEEANEFKKLLSTEDYSDLSFINVHKYIKHHFYNKKQGGFPPKILPDVKTPIVVSANEVTSEVVPEPKVTEPEVVQSPVKKQVRRKRKRATPVN